MLGPKLFVNYESHVVDIVGKHGLNVNYYSDDTQIYFDFKPEDLEDAIYKVEKYIADVPMDVHQFPQVK